MDLSLPSIPVQSHLTEAVVIGGVIIGLGLLYRIYRQQVHQTDLAHYQARQAQAMAGDEQQQR